MANINGAEYIKNAFVQLLKDKQGITDSGKTNELTTKYLHDNIINENEFQEIAADFDENFASEVKTLSETTSSGMKKEDVETWEDAVKYMSEKQGLDVGDLTKVEGPEYNTRHKVTYSYDNGTVVVARNGEGKFTGVTIETKEGESYSYNLNSGKETAEGIAADKAQDAESVDNNENNGCTCGCDHNNVDNNTPKNSGTGEVNDAKIYTDSMTLPMRNYLDWANEIDESRIKDDAELEAEEKARKEAEETEGTNDTDTSNDSSKTENNKHALKVTDCESAFAKAKEVHNAIDGACDDWDKLNEILGGLGNEELNRIMYAYKAEYGTNMKSDIEKQTAGFIFGWGNGKKKDAVIAVLTRAEGKPNENGKKEKEEMENYKAGGRW
ncbi:hypothetical protein IKA15_02085 [bacterium]|nr:hypothetical protein [bacterium]